MMTRANKIKKKMIPGEGSKFGGGGDIGSVPYYLTTATILLLIMLFYTGRAGEIHTSETASHAP